jgi:hypothetical protein
VGVLSRYIFGNNQAKPEGLFARNLEGAASKTRGLTQETPLRPEWRFHPPAQVTGLLANEERAVSSAPVSGYPAGFSPFKGRSLADAPVGCPVLLRLAGHSSSGRYIAGTNSVAIGVPFGTSFIFIGLRKAKAVIVWILVDGRRKSFKNT